MSAPDSLFAALATLQADLPRIVKGETGKIPSKDGKQGYSYKYADLADVNQVILPRLGALGLAFICRPTIQDGEFGLAYSLVHVSGEREDGFFPFGKGGGPQQIGSLITYARRYCLCAATGVAPDGDDDGAAAEQSFRQSAGDVFEQAAPTRPRQAANGNGAPRGQVARPAAQSPAAAPDDAEPDQDAQQYADEAHIALTISEVEAVHQRAREAGKIGAFIRSPASGKTGKLALYIDWKRKQLKDAEAAWHELNDAAGKHRVSIADLENDFKIKMGVDMEAATAAQMREFIASLNGAPA
jgi:hypothetical protein